MVVLFLLLSLLAAPATAQEAGIAAPEPLRPWGDLAERWILLPNEARRYRSLETEEAQRAFLEQAWRRRDPDPSDTENPVRQSFQLRVAQADELFSGEGRAGSMTDRGRVYILLGPPSQVSQKYHPTPQFSPLSMASNSRQRPKVLVETWSWRPEDLSPEVRRQLEARRWKIDLTVEFRVSSSRYSLMDGEELTRLSSRALVRTTER